MSRTETTPAPALTMPALTGAETLAWVDRTASGWRDLITAHPELLALPCDIMGVSTVAQLLQHIVAVQLRYAERLAGLPATDYAAIPYDSVEALYATHLRGMELFREQLASGVEWQERLDLVTRSMGTLRSSRKTVLFHALMHSIRHYAQLATLVRRHGIQPGWQMDYLLMDAERA